jgi:microcystin-dependent protein
MALTQVTAGVLADGAVTSAKITGLAGSITLFARNTAPSGYLKANGAAVSRSTYAALFTSIGTSFGAGDGSTTFDLPDLRGEFLRAWDDSRGIDASRVFGSLQLDAFQGHGHQLTYPFTGSTGGSLTTGLTTQSISSILANSATNPTELASFGAPRTAIETRPRNIALLACIKF